MSIMNVCKVSHTQLIPYISIRASLLHTSENLMFTIVYKSLLNLRLTTCSHIMSAVAANEKKNKTRTLIPKAS